jgi:thiamine pyrophosphokinase
MLPPQGNYLIEEGQSETFTMTVTKTAGTSGSSRASLTGVKWDSSDADTIMSKTYSSNLDSFKTDYMVLN